MMHSQPRPGATCTSGRQLLLRAVVMADNAFRVRAGQPHCRPCCARCQCPAVACSLPGERYQPHLHLHQARNCGGRGAVLRLQGATAPCVPAMQLRWLAAAISSAQTLPWLTSPACSAFCGRQLRLVPRPCLAAVADGHVQKASCCCLLLQFPFQPDQPPVPCSCGARNCRGRMN
jgi:hypothetical protein